MKPKWIIYRITAENILISNENETNEKNCKKKREILLLKQKKKIEINQLITK